LERPQSKTFEYLVLKKWLDLHKLKHLSTANLATKSVLTTVSRSLWTDSLTPALHVQNVAQSKYGVTVTETLFSAMKSKDGSAETAAYDFPTHKMFRRLGAR